MLICLKVKSCVSSKIFSEASISTLNCFPKTFVKKNKSVAKIALIFLSADYCSIIAIHFQDYFIWWELRPGGIGVRQLRNSVCRILDFGICLSLVSLAVGVLRGKGRG